MAFQTSPTQTEDPHHYDTNQAVDLHHQPTTEINQLAEGDKASLHKTKPQNLPLVTQPFHTQNPKTNFHVRNTRSIALHYSIPKTHFTTA